MFSVNWQYIFNIRENYISSKYIEAVLLKNNGFYTLWKNIIHSYIIRVKIREFINIHKLSRFLWTSWLMWNSVLCCITVHFDNYYTRGIFQYVHMKGSLEEPGNCKQKEHPFYFIFIVQRVVVFLVRIYRPMIRQEYLYSHWMLSSSAMNYLY